MLDEKVWSDKLYKHNPDKWGFALTTGCLSLMTYISQGLTRVWEFSKRKKLRVAK